MPWSWLIGVNYIDRLYCPEFVICHWPFIICHFQETADFPKS